MKTTLGNLFNTFIWLTLFLTPLVQATSLRGYEEVKVLLFLNLFISIGVLFILRIYFKEVSLRKSILQWLVLAWVGWLGITSVIGIHPERSFFGVFPYYQGWIVYLFLALFSFIVFHAKNLEQKVCWSLVSSATAVSLMAIVQTLLLLSGYSVVTYAGRVVSTFGQPNFYAGFILLTLPFWLYLWQKKEGKKILVVLILIQLSAIALSQSRTAAVLAGGFLCYLFLSKFVKSKVIKVSVIMFATIVVGFGIVNSGIFYREIYQPLTWNYQTPMYGNTQHRLYLWRAGLHLATFSPLTGFGLENIEYAIPRIYDFNHPHPPYYGELKDMTINRTHLYFLDLLLWGGVIATSLFIIILLIAFIKAREQYQKIFLIIFFFWILFQNLSIIHLLLFFLTTGLISDQSIDSKFKNNVRLFT